MNFLNILKMAKYRSSSGKAGWKHTQSLQSLRIPIVRYAQLILLGLSTAVIGIFIFNYQFQSWDFRNNLWGPARLLTMGESPYNISILFTNSRAVWFPMIIGALFPLGWLPETVATNVWLIFNIALAIAIVWLSITPYQTYPRQFVLVIILFFLSPVTIDHLKLGQFTLLAVFIYLTTALLFARLPVWIVGLLLAIGLSKPQLAVLFLPGLLFYSYKKFSLKRTLIIAGWICTGIALFTLPLFITHTNWLPDFITSLQENPIWLQPNIFRLFPIWISVPWGIVLWAVIATVIFVTNFIIWSKKLPAQAAFWSLGLTPLISPYVWSWDFVMLFPLLINRYIRLQNRWARYILGGGFILTNVITFAYRFPKTAVVSDHRFWFIPWLLWGFLGLATQIEKLQVVK